MGSCVASVMSVACADPSASSPAAARAAVSLDTGKARERDPSLEPDGWMADLVCIGPLETDQNGLARSIPTQALLHKSNGLRVSPARIDRDFSPNCKNFRQARGATTRVRGAPPSNNPASARIVFMDLKRQYKPGFPGRFRRLAQGVERPRCHSSPPEKRCRERAPAAASRNSSAARLSGLRPRTQRRQIRQAPIALPPSSGAPSSAPFRYCSSAVRREIRTPSAA